MLLQSRFLNFNNMAAGWVPSAISAGGGIFGSIFGGIFARRTARDNAKAQREFMDVEQQYALDQMRQQNDYNVDMFNRQSDYATEMWNKQNEYDSAANQVQRLRDAGLNPSLAMGNAGMSGVVSSPSGSGSSPAGVPTPNSAVNIPYLPFDDVLAKAAELAQIRRVDAETNKIKQETNTSAANENLVKAQTDYQNTLNKWADLSEQQRIEQTRSAITLALSGSDKNAAETQKILTETDWIGKLNESQIKDLQESANLKYEQALTEITKRNNLDANSKAALSQVSLNYMLGNKAAADAALSTITSDKVREEVKIAANEVNNSYYNALSTELKTKDYARGVDSHASMAGTAVLFTSRLADAALGAGSAAVDSAKDALNAAKNAAKSARKRWNSYKNSMHTSKHYSSQSFNPLMQ